MQKGSSKLLPPSLTSSPISPKGQPLNPELPCKEGPCQEHFEILPNMFPVLILGLLWPVDLLKVLASFVHEVFRCPELGHFLKSCLRQAEPGESPGRSCRAPREGTRPMPLPYPEVFKADRQDLSPQELGKLFVSVQVCFLKYLDLGRPSKSAA